MGIINGAIKLAISRKKIKNYFLLYLDDLETAGLSKLRYTRYLIFNLVITDKVCRLYFAGGNGYLVDEILIYFSLIFDDLKS